MRTWKEVLRDTGQGAKRGAIWGGVGGGLIGGAAVALTGGLALVPMMGAAIATGLAGTKVGTLGGGFMGMIGQKEKIDTVAGTALVTVAAGSGVLGPVAREIAKALKDAKA